MEVCQGWNYALHHTLLIQLLRKCSWQLKHQFSNYFAGDSEGFSHSKDSLLRGKYHGAEDRAELQGHIGELLIRMVNASNDGRKYKIAC